MKTIEEFIKEIESSENLKNELKAVKGESVLAEFLKKYDVSAAAKEFTKAFNARNEAEGEIDDDAVEAVAGGYGFFD